MAKYPMPSLSVMMGLIVNYYDCSMDEAKEILLGYIDEHTKANNGLARRTETDAVALALLPSFAAMIDDGNFAVKRSYSTAEAFIAERERRAKS